MIRQRKKRFIESHAVSGGAFVVRTITLFEVQFIPKDMEPLEDSGETLHRFLSGKATSAFLKSQGLKEK
jgi:hypothetical protein